MNSTNKTTKKQKILLILFGLIIASVIAEIALRINLGDEPQTFTTDPVVGFRMLPGGEIDERGYRNEETLATYNVVAMGDSMTYGAQAISNNSWPAQLSRISGRSVYNMGVAGYGPLQYSALTDEARELNPDLIIWGIYLGNDFTDTYELVYENEYSYKYWEPIRDQSIADKVRSLPRETPELLPNIDAVKADLSFFRRARIYVRDNSRLFLFLSQTSRPIREKLGIVEPREDSVKFGRVFAQNNPDISFTYDEEPIDSIFIPGHYLLHTDPDDEKVAEGFRISLKEISARSGKFKEEAIDFLVVLIPTKDYAYYEVIQRDNVSTPDSYEKHVGFERALTETILLECQFRKINCIDSRPALSEALLQGKNIYPSYHDGHPLALGYEIIANLINDNLE